MKVSELIQKLEEQKNEHGDLDVCLTITVLEETSEYYRSRNPRHVSYISNPLGKNINISGYCPD